MQSQSQQHLTSTSTSRVTRDAVARAVDSLLKWLRCNRRPDDEEDDDFLHLVLTLKKIPHRGRPAAFRVPLSRPFHSSACLLADDRPKSSLPPADALALVCSLALPVSVVLPLSDLRSLCRSPEARRSLAASHDLFLADRRLLPLLPSLLGSPFFDKKKKRSNKTPVLLDLAVRSWPEELRHVCGSTLFHLGPGTCSVVKVGRASHGRDEVIDNVMAAIEGVVGHVPKKWKNVRSLHLKATESLALPLYQGVPQLVSLKGEDDGGMVEVGNEEKIGSDDSDGQNRMKKAVDVLKKRTNNLEKTKDKDMKEAKRMKV